MKFPTALLAALLVTPALAAPTGQDVQRAATRTARALDGVLRDCPDSFRQIGSAQKKCVGVSTSVEQGRTKLSSLLGDDLYGVWRSRDGQRSVFNWLRTSGGYVYLRLQPDPEGGARTLVYLDTPPSSSPAPATPSKTTQTTPSKGSTTDSGTGSRMTVTPARPTPSTPQPAPTTARATPRPTTPEARSLVSLPFRRVLEVQPQRMNGADVRAVQDRLIALTRPSGGGRGDGWYGPVTAATVRAFQASNGLPVTGRVDRATWDRLFSGAARTFPASSIR